jgi:hypothetical protein
MTDTEHTELRVKLDKFDALRELRRKLQETLDKMDGKGSRRNEGIRLILWYRSTENVELHLTAPEGEEYGAGTREAINLFTDSVVENIKKLITDLDRQMEAL